MPYPSDHFIKALENLKQPYYGRRSEAITMALHDAEIALDNFPGEIHTPQSREWVARLKEFMNTDGIKDPTGTTGLWVIKAASFTKADIDELKDILKKLERFKG